ncbi:MAG: hypothetical protein LAQ69_33575 [Acidobacteriia bacterium]|nr:hypothetical protein [Terriglobia bacterium]
MKQLIADDKSGRAVDLAKDVHHRRQSPDSEALLLDAYGARIRSLMGRNLEREAKALVDLVRERFPSARDRMAEWTSVFAARQGDLDALLAPLNDASLLPERHAAIAAVIRHDAVDLRALAACRTLAPEHPLRTAADALWKAFEAVTSGPVAEEALALPEVSRQSPLAPWKMLVRAIAAYYRREDALCEKYLAAVEPQSAAARLAPALRALTHQKQQTLTSAVAALVSQASGNLETLRVTLKRLDQALDRRDKSVSLQEIRNAMAACRQAEPGLLEHLKQHISIRAMVAGLKVDAVATAMGGTSLKNAYFWRLRARAAEEDKSSQMSIPLACSLWEEFRRHAVHEGWFPGEGPAVAALYLHIADLWHRISPDEIADVQSRFFETFGGHADYYRGQPPEIRAVMLQKYDQDFYYLSSLQALERASKADPCSETFQKWLRCAVDGSPGLCDDVAERWCAALPNDIPPLLHLMESSEKRNALQKAFKFMERAERVDGLNADVRRARLRLLVSMATRHLRDKKAHLAERELRQLEALPQAQQGDRPAFVSALRWAWGQLGSTLQAAADAHAEAVRLLGGELAAQIVFRGVSQQCGMRDIEPAAPPKSVPLAATIGRACALGDDMGIPCQIPQSLFDRLARELSAKDFTAPVPPLLALGEAAVRQELFPMAYAIAGAGLAQGPEGQARFLFLRARGLPPWEEERRTTCLAVASELARHQRDSDLLNRIGEWRDEEMEWLGFSPDAEAKSISTEEIGRVVEREAKERGYPKSRPGPVSRDDDQCQCPACCAERGELPRELENMVDQFGPDIVAQAMAEILGIGGNKKRRKRRAAFGGNDDFLPF